jgi:hypothetical protein
MIHHHSSKRLHEDDINQGQDLLQSGSIKRPRVISPRSPLSDSMTTAAVVSFPDVVELPEDIQQRRKHSLDTLSEEKNGYNSEDDSEHSRQRRRIDDDGGAIAIDDGEFEDEESNTHRVMLPSNIIRKIPEVVLEAGHHHRHTNNIFTCTPTTIKSISASTTAQNQNQRDGPIIEEIPYNPLALVPYSPPPLVLFPGLSSGAYPQRDTMADEMRTSTTTQEGTGHEGIDRNVDAMEVLPMLTPPDAGYMLGPWTVDNTSAVPLCDEEDGDDAMEE